MSGNLDLISISERLRLVLVNDEVQEQQQPPQTAEELFGSVEGFALEMSDEELSPEMSDEELTPEISDEELTLVSQIEELAFYVEIVCKVIAFSVYDHFNIFFSLSACLVAMKKCSKKKKEKRNQSLEILILKRR